MTPAATDVLAAKALRALLARDPRTVTDAELIAALQLAGYPAKVTR